MSSSLFDLTAAQLRAEGRRFDAEALKQLPYKDLILACIGDAEELACPLKLVQTEKIRRLSELSGLSDEEIAQCSDIELLTDYERHMFRIEHELPCPAWADLSTPLQALFLIKCLRTHRDAPLHRLSQLASVLCTMSRTGTTSSLRGWAKLMLGTIEPWIRSPELLPRDLKAFRKALSSMELVRTGLSEREATIFTSALVRDYTCSAGRFHQIYPREA